MNIQSFLAIYGLSILIFFLVDIIWLAFVAKRFYQTYLADFLGPVNWVAAALFYLLFLLGLTFFAIYPAVQAGQWQVALIYGALFGFFTYMTYDLTNLATIKDWPLIVTVVDIVWGTVLGGAVASLTYYVYRFFL